MLSAKLSCDNIDGGQNNSKKRQAKQDGGGGWGNKKKTRCLKKSNKYLSKIVLLTFHYCHSLFLTINFNSSFCTRHFHYKHIIIQTHILKKESPVGHFVLTSTISQAFHKLPTAHGSACNNLFLEVRPKRKWSEI